MRVVRLARAADANRGAEHGVHGARASCWRSRSSSDFGLRDWLDEGRWDRLALHLFPLRRAYAALGVAAERPAGLVQPSAVSRRARCCSWSCWSCWRSTAARLHYLGLSLRALAVRRASAIPQLLDTVAAMTLNGALFYVAGSALDAARLRAVRRSRRGSSSRIAPFALLHPLGYLVRTRRVLAADRLALCGRLRSASCCSASAASAAASTTPAC